MLSHTTVEVRFSGGEHSGLVVQAPPDLAERLPDMKFVVLAGGQLYDLVEQCRLREARVIVRPGQQPPAGPSPVPAVVPPEPAVPEQPVLVAQPAPPRPRLAAPGAPLFQPARTG